MDRGAQCFENKRGSMQLLKSLLCLAAFLLVAQAAPGFTFGDDDAQPFGNPDKI